ncbi:MAG: hypothetical protein E6Q36_09305, partial [Chryseobacterium sp.]
MTHRITSCIRIESLGSLSWKTDFILEDSINKSVTEMIPELLPKNTYDPQPKDKIFLVSGCDVPRFKLKTFCETKKVALVKAMDKANAVFIGPEFLKEKIVSMNYWWYLKSEMLRYLEQIKLPGIVIGVLIKEIKDSTSEYICCEYKAKEQLKSRTYILPFNLKELDGDKEPRVKFKNELLVKEFLNVFNLPHVYDQTEILRQLNTGAQITDEDFTSVKRLFESKDMENVKLAMETIANCDYEKSCIHLLLLIQEFGDKIWGSPTKNHVNFKALLKFFEITDVRHLDINMILKSLLKRKLLNRENLDKLMPLVTERFQENAKLDYFTVEKIAPGTEI